MRFKHFRRRLSLTVVILFVFAAAGFANQVKVFDLQTNALLLATTDDPTEYGVDFISGDGDHIVFTKTGGVVEVWSIAGGARTHAPGSLGPAPRNGLAISGNILALCPALSQGGLVIIDVLTGATQQLDATCSQPFFSGTWLAYGAAGNIYVYDLLTETHTHAASGGGEPTLSPDWLAYTTPGVASGGVDSPGSQIAVRNRRTGVAFQVSVVPFNSFLSQPVLVNNNLVFVESHIDPALGFRRSDIYLMDLLTGGPPVNLTNNAGLMSSTRPSAAGGFIAFETVSNEWVPVGGGAYARKSDVMLYSLPLKRSRTSQIIPTCTWLGTWPFFPAALVELSISPGWGRIRTATGSMTTSIIARDLPIQTKLIETATALATCAISFLTPEITTPSVSSS